jgi:3-dehydroquinate dehydratase-2
MRILVVNGPNLDLLGTREPELYGTTTLTQLEDDLEEYSRKKLTGVSLVFGRSNREGEIIDLLNSGHGKFDGLVINPAGLAYNSYALRDSVLAFPHPKIVVHITNVFARESFRRNDLIAEVADGFVCGVGVEGYRLALDALVALAKKS